MPLLDGFADQDYIRQVTFRLYSRQSLSKSGKVAFIAIIIDRKA
jgi:hypothetical protein